jgi:hypothetical protein
MRAVAGVFHSRENAQCGLEALRRAGYSPENVSYLTPGSSEGEIHAVPVSETEQPGVGRAIGGAVGAALGMAGGFELGVGMSALVPGVGPVLVAGLAGMALLGAGGAALGVVAGGRADQDSTEGLPADEIFFYEDALRQGRSVVIVMANGKREAERAKELLAECGAESIDGARESWWIGLRDAEAEHYRALGYNFEQDHDTYRKGFEAALRRPVRGRTYDQAAAYLSSEYPDIWESDPFRTGFARGQEYERARAGSVTPFRAA